MNAILKPESRTQKSQPLMKHGLNTDEPPRRRDAKPRGVRNWNGKWSAGVLEAKAAGSDERGGRGYMRKKVRIVTRKSAKVHESPRKFAQIRAEVTRCYALLRVRLYFMRDDNNTGKVAGPEAGIPTEMRRESGVAGNDWHTFI